MSDSFSDWCNEMKEKSYTEKTNGVKKLPCRKNKKIWTDTMFQKKLLRNPSLMTDYELGQALDEYNQFRTAVGKYNWNNDPIKECSEMDAPFSPTTLTRIIAEASARLIIGWNLSLGRFKKTGKEG